MSEVKWIKIVTDIFDDEKMLLIESLPSSDSIIVIWFKLLCLAGKQNNGGVLMINDRIAYNEKMLSTIFRREESVVNLALKTFEDFGMIEIINNVITIPNWSKHQSIDQLENKKNYMRDYMKSYREKQKQIACKTNSKTNSKSNVSSLDIDIDKDIDKDKEIDIKKEINKEKKVKHKYGQYKNVLLDDEQYQKLKDEYAEADDIINFFDEQCEAKGYKYKNYYQAIKNWGIDAYNKRKGNKFTLDEMKVEPADISSIREKMFGKKEEYKPYEVEVEDISLEELRNKLYAKG